ncbi:hypothetical protein AAG906_039311 [Vitis piasezkii]
MDYSSKYLCQTISWSHQTSTMTVTDFLHSVKAYTDELAILGTPIEEEDLIEKILDGLASLSTNTKSEVNLPITTNPTNRNNPMNTNWRPHKTNTNWRPSHSNSSTNTGWRPPATFPTRPPMVTHSGTPTHTNRPPPHPYQGFCQICGIQGHTTKRCPSFQLVPIQSSTTSATPPANFATPWQPRAHYAANTTTNNPSWLLGAPLIISVSLPSSTTTFTLNDVLYVPSMKKNLIYISQFCISNNVSVEFLPSCFNVKDLRTGTILLTGNTKDGVYEWPAAQPASSPILAFSHQEAITPSAASSQGLPLLETTSPLVAPSPQQASSAPQPSPQPSLTTTEPQIPVPPPTQHRMTTQAKNNITKPIQKLNLHTHKPTFQNTTPTSISQALKYHNWHQAMSKEYDALVRNGTWELVPPKDITNLVSCKWIFHIKRNSDGSINRYKARLVSKGFHQRPGVDYHETFSLVVKPTTVRLVLSIAISNAIYGLKQAPRAWYRELRQFLLTSGFKNSHSDTSLFVLRSSNHVLYLLVYVDDIILTGSSDTLVSQFVDYLAQRFSLKDLGPLSYFLGVEVVPHRLGILLSQRRYIQDLLKRTNMADAKPVLTPLPTSSTTISLTSGTPLSDPTPYRVVVGSLHSKKQQTVARSSIEAKYSSVAATTAELRWVGSLLSELGISLTTSPVVYCDNVGATQLSSNPIFHSHMKHVAIDYHFIRDQVQSGLLRVAHVSSVDQLADLFTKPRLLLNFCYYYRVNRVQYMR